VPSVRNCIKLIYRCKMYKLKLMNVDVNVNVVYLFLWSEFSLFTRQCIADCLTLIPVFIHKDC